MQIQVNISLGVDRETFDQVYLGQLPLLVRGALSGSQYQISRLNDVLHSTDATYSHIRLHDGRGFVEEKEFIEDRIVVGLRRRRIRPEPLLAHLARGSTLLLARLEVRDRIIEEICVQLSEFLAQPTIANGYLSTGELPSFGHHWDTHDVIAVQLNGRKAWRVFRPTMLDPIMGQTSRDQLDKCPSESFLDVILEEGDALYLPRGWWHCATSVATTSFHLAVGVHPPLMKDYFAWAFSNFLSEHREFRRSLPSFQKGRDRLEESMVAMGELIFKGQRFDDYRQHYRLMNDISPRSSFDIISRLKNSG